MSPEESPQTKYDRLKRQLQDSILSDYPNPERKGCPGDAALQSLAERASDENVENDANWHHLTHCSECYREFLNLRFKVKTKAETRRHLVQWVAALVLVLAIGLFFWSKHATGPIPEGHQNTDLAYSKVTIDIPAMTRSETGRPSPPIVLQRKPTELTVNCPVGSKAGEYEFQLLKQNQQILSAHAGAAILNGTTAFTIRIDFSRIPAGSYSMSVRQPPWDWSYVPVVVQ
jgi:hypothetical protein